MAAKFGLRVTSLVNIIADPQFLLAGFDNKAIRARLREHGRYRGKTDKQLAGIVTRTIRLVRDHGIIHKVPSRRRYRISKAGLSLAHAVTAALSSSTKELMKKAAWKTRKICALDGAKLLNLMGLHR